MNDKSKQALKAIKAASLTKDSLKKSEYIFIVLSIILFIIVAEVHPNIIIFIYMLLIYAGSLIISILILINYNKNQYNKYVISLDNEETNLDKLVRRFK